MKNQKPLSEPEPPTDEAVLLQEASTGAGESDPHESDPQASTPEESPTKSIREINEEKRKRGIAYRKWKKEKNERKIELFKKLVWIEMDSVLLQNGYVPEARTFDERMVTPLGGLQRATGYIRGKVLSLDLESAVGVVEIDGHQHAYFDTFLYHQSKHSLEPSELERIIGSTQSFLFWPCWSGRFPKDLSAREHYPLRKLRMNMISRAPREDLVGKFEAGGKIKAFWSNGFYLKFWSVHKRRSFQLLIHGEPPKRKFLHKYVWVKGHFDPETGMLFYDELEKVKFLDETDTDKFRELYPVKSRKREPIQAEDLPVEVLYQDEQIIVVVKPPEMVSHPSTGHWTGTLLNALLHLTDRTLAFMGERVNNSNRHGIVHRLDKDTSGVMIACKQNDAHVFIAKQFEKHTIERSYRAIVYALGLPDKGTFNTGHAKSQRFYSRYTGEIDTERRAITHYEVLERFSNDFALVSCSLETGRTHQIRFHFSEAGFPLLGDPLYGDLRTESPLIKRQALHATVLGFEHPNGEHMRFEVPPPDDFQQALKHFRCLTQEQTPE
mgnify:CR=1 FL=1